MKKITMYQVTHKRINYIPKGRTPIFVGTGNNEDNYLRDNTGDNISHLNPYFCELTALYWIWKNDSYSDYIGIEHYRRFFCEFLRPIKTRKIEKLLNNYNIIVAKKYYYKDSLYNQYSKEHIIDDLTIVRQIIEDEYNDYLSYFNQVLEGNSISLYNMVICNKDTFNSYCSWLFDILLKAEKKINYINRDKYQQRVFGFLSERLFNVWLLKNVKNMKELHIFFLYDNKFKTKFKLLIKRMKYIIMKITRKNVIK